MIVWMIQDKYIFYSISSVIRRSFFPSKTIPKNLDPSYKMDLDLENGLGRVKCVLLQKTHGIDLYL